jgi:hypothetical protein
MSEQAVGAGVKNTKFILSPEQNIPLGDLDIGRRIFFNFIKKNSHGCTRSVAAAIIIYAYFSVLLPLRENC